MQLQAIPERYGGLSLVEINGLPAETIGVWIDASFLAYRAALKPHEVGYHKGPLVCIDQDIDFEVAPQHRLSNLYHQALNPGFGERFDYTLRKKLLERMDRVFQDPSDRESADYLNFGLQFIGHNMVHTLEDTLIKAVDTRLDFEYDSYPESNLYVEAIAWLSILGGCEVEWWNPFLDDPRLIVYAALAIDRTIDDQLRTVIRTFDRLEDPESEYRYVFRSYICNPNSFRTNNEDEQQTKPPAEDDNQKRPKLPADKTHPIYSIARLRRLIRDETEGPKQEMFLGLLEKVGQ
jgi:hypothetical protein